jgi:RNA polymerase sigma-70 factor, ECF subfamily
MPEYVRTPETSFDILQLARRRFEAGRVAWPHVALGFEAFHCYFARHATAETLPIESHAADMYLACACSLGVDAALVAFEDKFTADMARAVASVDPSRAFVEDVLQATRERLLIGRGSTPGKIADFAGRATLRTWLCAVAVRWAISQLRRKGGQRHDRYSAEHDVRLAKNGPEFEYLRRRYTVVFEEAVQVAIGRLPREQRLLLRLNLDGMTIDKLGAAYRVGRSTAARWLASARRDLLAAVRDELRTKLRVTSTELDSIGADVRSQLDLSLRRLLVQTSRSGSDS